MSIHVKWQDASKTTLVYHFENEWTWHDAKEALQTALFLQDDSPADVSYIYDLSDSRVNDRTCIMNIQRLLKLILHPKPKHIVIVERGFRLQMMFDDVQPFDLQFAKTIDSAQNIIHSAG